jgi:hypothetical protein
LRRGGHCVLGRLALGTRTRAAHEPAHRLGVSVWIQVRQNEREVVFCELLVLALGPRTAEYLGGGFLESLPLVVAFELELEVSDQGLGRAIAEPLLDLAHGGSVDVLVVAGDAADVEDDGEGLDLLA